MSWVTWALVAIALVSWVMALRNPLIRITESGIDVRDRARAEPRHIPREKVGCLLDHGPDRMFLRVVGEDKPVRLPTKALSARERFLLARCLTHYDLGQVFN